MVDRMLYVRQRANNKKYFHLHILDNVPDFTSLSENVTRYFDYEAYGQYLDDNGRFVETDHGIYELP